MVFYLEFVLLLASFLYVSMIKYDLVIVSTYIRFVVHFDALQKIEFIPKIVIQHDSYTGDRNRNDEPMKNNNKIALRIVKK